MQKILVVNRPSNVAGNYVSRSISARLLEPLHYLRDHNQAEFLVAFPGQDLPDVAVDWAFFNKSMDEASLALALKLQAGGTRILYDLDDHILAYPSYSGAHANARNIEIIHQFLELSDIVTAANANIVRLYRNLKPDIRILTNGIYVERYLQQERLSAQNAKLRIGFVNADFMKIVNFKSDWTHAIEELRKRYSHLTFSYYGDFAPDRLGLEGWEWLGSVDFETYRRSLFQPVFDVGLVPLGGEEDPDSYEFNLCKNPFKFLEFGAAGIAGVYSDVAVYRDVVSNGKTGFLAQSSREAWIQAASDLIENDALRAQMAEDGRKDVIDNHHIRHAATALAGYLEDFQN